MTASKMTPERRRELRDLVLLYVYENGSDMPYWSVPGEQIQKALSISRQELSDVGMMLHNQGLIATPGIAGSIGLNEAGQAEAEALRPRVLMRDPPPSSNPVTINAHYSVVQVAGSHSSQTAHYSVDQSRAMQLLDQIERSIPDLDLEPAEKEEAKGLAASLRRGLKDLPAAGQRAMAGVLVELIKKGGSELGESLMQVFGLSAGA